MEENQFIAKLTDALVKSGPDYDPEKSREVAQATFTALIEQAGADPGTYSEWKMENTCISNDLGLDSMDFIEVLRGLEDALDVLIPDERDLRSFGGKVSVLDLMQLGYEIKYNP